MKYMGSAIAAAAFAVFAQPASAVEPIGGEPLNVVADIDFASLGPDNFYDVIVPKAKEEGTVILFDFTNSFEPLFLQHLIPAFEEKYGIKVDYQRGDRDAATQQLIATNNSGEPAPFDVFFIASPSIFPLMDAGAMANLPMHELLPNGTTLDPELATTTNGLVHGGRYMLFHRNQTALIYNSALLEGEPPETVAALLEWAKANPGRFGITSPGRGGAGDGFLQSVMMALVTGDECRAPLFNYDITREEADAYVASDCMAPVWDYFRELLPNSEVTTGNSDTLNLVANGEALVGTAWEDMAYDFIGRGLLPPSSRLHLVETGHAGGGDGFLMPPRPQHPAAAMLLMDFLLSPEMQVLKLKVNGSRSANPSITTEGQFTDEQRQHLIPDEQFATRTFPNLSRPVIQAGITYFQDNILTQ